MVIITNNEDITMLTKNLQNFEVRTQNFNLKPNQLKIHKHLQNNNFYKTKLKCVNFYSTKIQNQHQ